MTHFYLHIQSIVDSYCFISAFLQYKITINDNILLLRLISGNH